jgi:hypothetical protein
MATPGDLAPVLNGKMASSCYTILSRYLDVEHKPGSCKNISLDQEADELISKSLVTFQS